MSDPVAPDSPSPAPQAPPPAATVEPSPSPTDAAPALSPPPASPGWSRRYLAWGLAASSAAAAVTVVLLRGGGGAADPPPGPALDHASLGPAISREAPSVAPGAAIKWAADSSGKWVTPRTRSSVAFELPAENTASSWLTRVRPILVVRCVSNTTDAFVYTQVPPVIEPRDDRTVRLQFDDEDEHTTRWAGAADHDALFSPDPISFARRLARAQTLHFGFTPHNGPPATIVFDVRGFDARIGSIARTCRWK